MIDYRMIVTFTVNKLMLNRLTLLASVGKVEKG